MTCRTESGTRAVFDDYPPKARARLLQLRTLILSTARSIDGVGPLTETLKWGEPAYLTEASRSGSTIRIGWKERSPDKVAVYLNCRTTLIDSFRTRFPDLEFEGNRAILLDIGCALPKVELRECLAAALTYHKRPR